MYNDDYWSELRLVYLAYQCATHTQAQAHLSAGIKWQTKWQIWTAYTCIYDKSQAVCMCVCVYMLNAICNCCCTLFSLLLYSFILRLRLIEPRCTFNACVCVWVCVTLAKRARKQERQRSQTELIDGIVRKRAKMHSSMHICVCVSC